MNRVLETWLDGGWLLLPIAIVCVVILFLSLRVHDLLRQRDLPAARRELRFLRAFVTAAPLLGLLGTVIGMIGTFDAVAGNAAAGKALGVAGGIRTALITTQFGLVAALPGVLAIGRFNRRLQTLQTLETDAPGVANGWQTHPPNLPTVGNPRGAA